MRQLEDTIARQVYWVGFMGVGLSCERRRVDPTLVLDLVSSRSRLGPGVVASSPFPSPSFESPLLTNPVCRSFLPDLLPPRRPVLSFPPVAVME